METPNNSYVEIINPNIQRGQVKQALFDFDGTLSLIREGWQGIMVSMMVEKLMETPDHESERDLTLLVRDYIDRLTGKQTIYQMIRLTEEIQQRGGTPLNAGEYKWQYLDLMDAHIKSRIKGLKDRSIQPQALMVPGSVDILESLFNRNVTCFLASGTDEVFVKKEVKALGIDHYFAGIYGAQDDYKNFSKRMVIEQILRGYHLSGPELVAFGDGFVEIEDAHAAGGVTIGVASNEASRCGIDEWKRKRLINAGADLIIPDYQHQDKLIAYLFEEAE
jgi:phosphoglycolate phosphatase-like HAD superfamily hydrolase